jgi:glutamate-1-semialdehyde 2,1-aminomutase
LAQLRLCTDEVYAHVDATAATVAGLIAGALTDAGVAFRINTAGSLFSVFFIDGEVVDFDSAKHTSVPRYAAFFHAMLDAGIYLPPSAFEAWFVGASHDTAAIERIAGALPHAARAAAAVAPTEVDLP